MSDFWIWLYCKCWRASFSKSCWHNRIKKIVQKKIYSTKNFNLSNSTNILQVQIQHLITTKKISRLNIIQKRSLFVKKLPRSDWFSKVQKNSAFTKTTIVIIFGFFFFWISLVNESRIFFFNFLLFNNRLYSKWLFATYILKTSPHVFSNMDFSVEPINVWYSTKS